jgi:hypothetical protein
MRGRILIRIGGAALGVLLSASVARADLIVTPLGGSLDANALANLLVAGGGGITIDSATYTGASGASGTYSGGAGIVGIDNGILLTSGAVGNVVGPNDASGQTTNNGLAGDTALTTLSGDPTFDASILEITFTPTGNSVEFSYVFGSEEYLEFVNAGVNDVFGFFVNGTNFALIPSTTTPVSIDTVNTGSNSGFFVNNTDAHLNTQLDGLTTVLSFVAPVNAGQQNTLRLGIADGGDRILDSAVFIKAGSFQVCGDPPLPPCGGGDGGGGGGGEGGGNVPEPGSLALMAMGVLGFASRVRHGIRV